MAASGFVKRLYRPVAGEEWEAVAESGGYASALRLENGAVRFWSAPAHAVAAHKLQSFGEEPFAIFQWKCAADVGYVPGGIECVEVLVPATELATLGRGSEGGDSFKEHVLLFEIADDPRTRELSNNLRRIYSLNIETYHGTSEWMLAVPGAAKAFDCDAQVSPQTFFERVYGEVKRFGPAVAVAPREDVLWIYPGSFAGIPLNPSSVSGFYCRLWTHLLNWSHRHVVQRVAFCVGSVVASSSPSDNDIMVSGFMESLRIQMLSHD